MPKIAPNLGTRRGRRPIHWGAHRVRQGAEQAVPVQRIGAKSLAFLIDQSQAFQYRADRAFLHQLITDLVVHRKIPPYCR